MHTDFAFYLYRWINSWRKKSVWGWGGAVRNFPCLLVGHRQLFESPNTHNLIFLSITHQSTWRVDNLIFTLVYKLLIMAKTKILKRINLNLLLALSIQISILPINTIKAQKVCNKTSDVLECFSCSNTASTSKCSDENGKPTISKWDVAKSTSGQPTTNLR